MSRFFHSCIQRIASMADECVQHNSEGHFRKELTKVEHEFREVMALRLRFPLLSIPNQSLYINDFRWEGDLASKLVEQS